MDGSMHAWIMCACMHLCMYARMHVWMYVCVHSGNKRSDKNPRITIGFPRLVCVCVCVCVCKMAISREENG